MKITNNMKITNKLFLSALALALAVATLSACGGRGGSGNQPAASGTVGDKANGGGSAGGPSAGNPMQCPEEADVAAVVGAQVEKKPRGAATCYYETPDFKTSIVIMSFAPGRADQLLEEMRESAKPYGVEVEAVGVGERAYVWGSPGWGQGFVVAGGRGYMLDVSKTAGGDTKGAVSKLLKMMLG